MTVVMFSVIPDVGELVRDFADIRVSMEAPIAKNITTCATKENLKISYSRILRRTLTDQNPLTRA